VTIAVIAARIVVMTAATVAMIVRIGAAALGCCGGSAMGGPTRKRMALVPLSAARRLDRAVMR
jgi:hypothetical protein